jgi:arylsulfatase A-like enzyme
MRAAKRTAGAISAFALLLTLTLAVPAVGSAGRPATRLAAPTAQPNILLIVSDDQAWSTFDRRLMPAVYDQLVDQGVLFDRAYVNTALCCPSRAQILTGLYEHHTGVDANDVPLTRPTIVDALGDAGYHTYLAGKYLNSWADCAPRPEFEHWACVVSHEPSSNSLLNPFVNVDGAWQTLAGYQPDRLGDLLGSWIQATPAGEPFFAMYTPTTPHLPADDPRYDDLQVEPPRGPSFDQATLDDNTPRFARRTPLTQDEIGKSDERYRAMAHATRSFDDAVDRLLSSLGNRVDDTLVVYLSDNGFLYGEHRRFGKNDPWEESVRVPMVVRYPRALATSRSFVSKSLVQNVDIAPTIADVAGLAWSADGVSLLPLLRGRKAVRKSVLIEHCRGARRHDPTCSGLYYEGGNTDTPGFEGIITSRYKYVRYDDGSRQLIDLAADPGELRNLLAAPGRTSGRAAMIERRLASALTGGLRSAPRTTIVTGPGDSVRAGVAVFTFFSPSLYARYRCRLSRDGHPSSWRSCAGERQGFSGLEEGHYRFEVAGTDGRGRWDMTPASRTFRVEGSDPAVHLTDHPDELVDEPIASFTYETDPSNAQSSCRLTPWGGHRDWEPCDASGAVYQDLPDGAYLFEVVARVHAGPDGVSEPAAWFFTVDTTGPSFRIAGPPPATRSSSASFRFVASEETRGTVICSVDGGGSSPCGSGRFRVRRVSSGTHRFTISAVDRVGNRSVTEYAWIADREGPKIALMDQVERVSDERIAAFNLWTDADPQLFVCRLDHRDPMPCFTDTLLTGLRDGRHLFEVLAEDEAGNRSEVMTYSWRVDTTAPGIVMTGTPAQGTTTTVREANFEIMRNEPSTILCALDERAFKSCRAEVDLAGLAPGDHSFAAYAVDRAGNTSIVLRWEWTVV